MERRREDILRSITALLAEVNGVALSIGRTTPRPVHTPLDLPSEDSSMNYSQDGLISRSHADAITDALLRIQSATASNSNSKVINALVCKTLNSVVESWLQQNLADLVEEVVDEQLARTEKKKWSGT